jgi:hypothetical protein
VVLFFRVLVCCFDLFTWVSVACCSSHWPTLFELVFRPNLLFRLGPFCRLRSSAGPDSWFVQFVLQRHRIRFSPADFSCPLGSRSALSGPTIARARRPAVPKDSAARVFPFRDPAQRFLDSAFSCVRYSIPCSLAGDCPVPTLFAFAQFRCSSFFSGLGFRFRPSGFDWRRSLSAFRFPARSPTSVRCLRPCVW